MEAKRSARMTNKLLLQKGERGMPLRIQLNRVQRNPQKWLQEPGPTTTKIKRKTEQKKKRLLFPNQFLLPKRPKIIGPGSLPKPRSFPIYGRELQTWRRRGKRYCLGLVHSISFHI